MTALRAIQPVQGWPLRAHFVVTAAWALATFILMSLGGA